MRRALWMTLLCGFICSGAALAEDAALRAVEDCRARLDPRADLGIERVRQRCPDLLPALAKAPWRGLLPNTLGKRREEISAESLRALAELVRRSADAGAGRAGPSREALTPVLAELGEQGKQGATRWERFKRWLKQKLSKRDDDDKAGWLDKWTRQLHTSEGVARAITYLGYALVMGLLLFVIWSELRAAGLLGGARRGGRAASPAAEWRRRLMLADVLAAPLAERPGMMLRLLGEALSRARRLPPAEGMTVGDILQRAQLDAEQQREALARVAHTAEQARYAARVPGDAKLEEAVATARELLGTFARMPGGSR
jgi:hypothetical protein